eukprot:m.215678 g.215678  ORF g.215678 m.215678 type:complete len:434 (+) comp25626_c0_seq1:1949-3250(+)
MREPLRRSSVPALDVLATAHRLRAPHHKPLSGPFRIPVRVLGPNCATGAHAKSVKLGRLAVRRTVEVCNPHLGPDCRRRHVARRVNVLLGSLGRVPRPKPSDHAIAVPAVVSYKVGLVVRHRDKRTFALADRRHRSGFARLQTVDQPEKLAARGVRFRGRGPGSIRHVVDVAELGPRRALVGRWARHFRPHCWGDGKGLTPADGDGLPGGVHESDPGVLCPESAHVAPAVTPVVRSSSKHHRFARRGGGQCQCFPDGLEGVGHGSRITVAPLGLINVECRTLGLGVGRGVHVGGIWSIDPTRRQLHRVIQCFEFSPSWKQFLAGLPHELPDAAVRLPGNPRGCPTIVHRVHLRISGRRRSHQPQGHEDYMRDHFGSTPWPVCERMLSALRISAFPTLSRAVASWKSMLQVVMRPLVRTLSTSWCCTSVGTAVC